MDNVYDYNAAFKATSLKLKKRFLRKPNVSDAIEEYNALSRQLENEECYGLSAYCQQQVGKIYKSIGNSISESGALQAAAKSYLNSEISSTIEMGIVSFNEDLLSAISLYEDAIKLHCEQNEKYLAGKLCVELGDIVQKFDRYFEAIVYYERAVNLFININSSIDNTLMNAELTHSLEVIIIRCKLATLQVYTCDYSGALIT
jgi:tetratricopeptide (TPR) repeat protein